jgi:hypothetical protein
MPNSVIVGRLRAVEGDAITLDGKLRYILSPGVSVNGIPLDTSITIVVTSRDGVQYVEALRQTPEWLFAGLRGRESELDTR